MARPDVDRIAEFLSWPNAERFVRGLRSGQRLGQAFFNALPEEQATRLLGTTYDPFYSDNPETVYRALDFLTR